MINALLSPFSHLFTTFFQKQKENIDADFSLTSHKKLPQLEHIATKFSFHLPSQHTSSYTCYFTSTQKLSLKNIKIQCNVCTNITEKKVIDTFSVTSQCFSLQHKICVRSICCSSQSIRQQRNRIKKALLPLFSLMPTEIKMHIASFLPQKEIGNFLGISKVYANYRENYLYANSNAVNTILHRYQGSVHSIPKLLSADLQKIGPSIKQLELHSLPITDMDFQHIATMFSNLHTIQLMDNSKLTNEIKYPLMQLKKLCHLDIKNCPQITSKINLDSLHKKRV